jgi:hypothetical protein
MAVRFVVKYCPPFDSINNINVMFACSLLLNINFNVTFRTRNKVGTYITYS